MAAEDPPTLAAGDEPPTELAAVDAAETTVLSRQSETPAAELAWSIDTGETGDFTEQSDVDDSWDDESRAYEWGTVKIFAGLMAVAVIAAAWLVGVWVTHRDEHDTPVAAATLPAVVSPAPIAAPPTGSTPTAAAPLPPPPTVTVTETPTPVAAPPPVTAAPRRVDPDQAFLSELRSNGIAVTDPSMAEQSAREGCDYMAAGHTPQEAVQLAMRNNPTLTLQDAEVYEGATIRAYCPQYAG
ncbi:DUF732 domain-containing protein [Mycobacterium celatum]|uniref:DUF732 domain-containing protein n=1 Tax=Mycobacterium celatum TaxID=28045 RepID=UPI0015D4817F|nr:DUF732 domain-containing protein [Mycobacterium celatum]